MAYETALWELQKAIYQRLSTDQRLLFLVTGVFDATGENQVYPYVVIGEPSVLPLDTKSTFGEEISVTIHAWSDYSGKKQAYDILDACLSALSYKLDMTGFETLKVERTGLQVFDDIDPSIRHGVLRMRYSIKNI
ncbi:DUF3168 domain-containing protein [Bacillus sp. REN10]|uniref:DUF3168 domain-containing protein n=1 Tax=Bacillus sp. REN10 TaxID=2782541 RepID=UPI00193C4608|nr:DUF3168 domain-containing protein [Bacillus sp. REN10]